MLKKRIIPCLDIMDGRVVKGVQFEGLVDMGDPVVLARQYASEAADELVLLDIAATVQQRNARTALIRKVAAAVHIPFTVGGGIASAGDAALVIQAGADKVSINSAAAKEPRLIGDIANRFGSQCVVVAMDIRENAEGRWLVYLNGGRIATSLEAVPWAQEAAHYGAGELLVTSMDHDGTRSGFALEITEQIRQSVNIPVIASGGAGCKEDFRALFQYTGVAAALAAGIFHSGKVPVPLLKAYLKEQKIPIR